MQRLINFPGLRDEPGLFERAYQAAGQHIARVRFVPQQVDPALADELSGPAASIGISVRISVSFVDSQGQVEAVGPGRFLVADGEAYSWQSDSGVALDADAWLDSCAAEAIARASAWAAMQRAAAAAGLLAPLPPVPPVPALTPAIEPRS